MTETRTEDPAEAGRRILRRAGTRLLSYTGRSRVRADGVRTLSRLAMIGLSILGGIVAGLGAVLFRDLIGLVHNLFFLGSLSVAYDANAHTPAGPWGPFVILVPVVGALGVTFLVTRFASEARGHGVPEVMDAVHYTGAALTSIVMNFEMTLDYSAIVPISIAVAFSYGSARPCCGRASTR